MAKMYTELLEQIRNVDAIRTIDRLGDAIAAGDMEKAMELHKENVVNKTNCHHFLVRYINMIIEHFKRYAPDEAIYECMEDYALWCYPPFLQKWIDDYKAGKVTYKDFPMEEFLVNRAVLWQKTHDNADQVWEEDEKKITFTLTRCNSGGFLIGESGDKIAVMDTPDARCYNKEGFPAYCINCTTMWEYGWYKWFGWPLMIMDVPTVGCSGKCVMQIYKDPKDIPDSYYENLGLERKI